MSRCTECPGLRPRSKIQSENGRKQKNRKKVFDLLRVQAQARLLHWLCFVRDDWRHSFDFTDFRSPPPAREEIAAKNWIRRLKFDWKKELSQDTPRTHSTEQERCKTRGGPIWTLSTSASLWPWPKYKVLKRGQKRSHFKDSKYQVPHLLSPNTLNYVKVPKVTWIKEPTKLQWSKVSFKVSSFQQIRLFLWIFIT